MSCRSIHGHKKGLQLHVLQKTKIIVRRNSSRINRIFTDAIVVASMISVACAGANRQTRAHILWSRRSQRSTNFASEQAKDLNAIAQASKHFSLAIISWRQALQYLHYIGLHALIRRLLFRRLLSQLDLHVPSLTSPIHFVASTSIPFEPERTVLALIEARDRPE